MELKQEGTLAHAFGETLLIVPYGIETEYLGYGNFYPYAFNRTLWN